MSDFLLSEWRVSIIACEDRFLAQEKDWPFNPALFDVDPYLHLIKDLNTLYVCRILDNETKEPVATVSITKKRSNNEPVSNKTSKYIARKN